MGLFDLLRPAKKDSRAQLRKIDAALADELDAQDRQHAQIMAAEARYEADGNVNALIKFWEDLWNSGGLLFNGSKWTFRLPDLYITQKRYDDALCILKKIKNPQYSKKVQGYTERITKAKAHISKK